MFLQGEAERRWQTARCSAPRCLAQTLRGEFVPSARLGTRTKAGCQDEELQGRGVPLARWARGARDWTWRRLLRSCLCCIPGRASGEARTVAGRSARLVQTSRVGNVPKSTASWEERPRQTSRSEGIVGSEPGRGARPAAGERPSPVWAAARGGDTSPSPRIYLATVKLSLQGSSAIHLLPVESRVTNFLGSPGPPARSARTAGVFMAPHEPPREQCPSAPRSHRAAACCK